MTAAHGHINSTNECAAHPTCAGKKQAERIMALSGQTGILPKNIPVREERCSQYPFRLFKDNSCSNADIQLFSTFVTEECE